MSDDREFGNAHGLQADSAHCGLRPSQEAMEEGFTVDFSQAKKLLEKPVMQTEQDVDSDSHTDQKTK